MFGDLFTRLTSNDRRLGAALDYAGMDYTRSGCLVHGEHFRLQLRYWVPRQSVTQGTWCYITIVPLTFVCPLALGKKATRGPVRADALVVCFVFT